MRPLRLSEQSIRLSAFLVFSHRGGNLGAGGDERREGNGVVARLLNHHVTTGIREVVKRVAETDVPSVVGADLELVSVEVSRPRVGALRYIERHVGISIPTASLRRTYETETFDEGGLEYAVGDINFEEVDPGLGAGDVRVIGSASASEVLGELCEVGFVIIAVR